MILVTLGTQDKKFYRLLDALEKNIESGNITEEVIVQAGYSSDYKSKYMKIFDLLPMDEFENLIKKCDLLITHGGVGSIITGLKNNKKVIAAARLKEYGEHTNNHQLQIIENFSNRGYILPLDNFDELDKVLEQSKKYKPKKYKSNTNKMIKFVEKEINNYNNCETNLFSIIFRKISNIINNNRIFFIILAIMFSILCFCHFNTFLGNDDLPYSFFKRLNERVTNPFQVIWDNLRYYKSTNGRFLIHCIVMSLLIFGKNLWSFFNPVIIITIITIICALACKSKKQQILICLAAASLFLCLYDFKNIIYWVAGSINYLWVICAIFIFIYLYLQKNLLNKTKLMCLYLFILSSLHENAFAFCFIFMITLCIIRYIKYKKIDYFKYLIPIILGGLILFLAPGNINRGNSYIEWNKLSLIEKLNISMPYVSNSIFKLFNINNIVPTLYLLVLLIRLVVLNNANNRAIIIKLFFIIFLLVQISIYSFFDIRYLTFSIAITAFMSEFYIHYICKNIEYIPIQFGYYATAFSMIITPLYNSGRPNLFIYMYFIFIICKFIIEIIGNKMILYNALTIIFSILFIFTICNEIHIYYNIGKIQRNRITEINNYNNSKNSNILYLETIPEKYAKYHQDCNAVDENFWTYNWYIWYYGIPSGTKIRYK